jgi:corrinoid protein of di/trimethylamine methyltransferase
MDKQEILNNLKKSIETWNVALAKESARKAIDAGITPLEAVETGLGKGMEFISHEFDEARIYLPQVLAASNAMEAALKIFEPHMTGDAVATKGTVVLGTVQGDIHEIGKNVVAAMLTGAGYRVVDLGRDVPIEQFVETAKDKKADVVGASALMTTTIVGQKEIVELLKDENVPSKTVFGGAPCSPEWVESIGGDAYCPSGAEATATIEKLMKGAI